MNPIITFNDISINIKIIDDKKSHYQLNIPNNEANKKLIEKTIFKFDKCGSVIIMHDDVNVFQLSKMECNYSDYIEIKEQLEYTKNELDFLKNKINNNENYYNNTECIMTVLQQQILKKLINNEHLMQQQMKFYYDKETEQMKVCEDLPYIIVRNVNNIIEEKILHEKSQLIWTQYGYGKIRNYLISNENIKNKHIKYYRAFFDDNPDYDIQHIIPAKKMLKIWKRKVINIPLNPILEVTFFPVDIYTNETHIINYVDIFAIWYGDIEYKDDVPDDYNFKYIYDNISKF